MAAQEVGRHVGVLADMGEIVLAVKRGGNVVRFDELGNSVLEAGDSVVVIRHVVKR